MRLFQSAVAGALITCALSTAAHAATFSYANFNDTTGLTLVGNAATVGSPAVLRVVPATGSQAGAAYNTTAFTLGASDTFSTQFQFQMTNPGGVDPADGLDFVLAANPTGLGTGGFGIGYNGVGHSVAIEFDTFYNGPGSVAGNGGGANVDDLDGSNNPSSNHVAIDKDGVLTNSNLTNVYGNGSCGFSAAQHGDPVQNPNTAAGCMSNGDIWTVNIGYDGSNLSVVLFDPAKGVSFTALSNVPIDIASLLGTDQAFVGFTSGTGAGWENTDVLNWSFANTTTFASPGVPEPASWALMIAGFGLTGGLLRRRRTVVAQV